jgi:hypothetical protein
MIAATPLVSYRNAGSTGAPSMNHPAITLLDGNGTDVLLSNGPVSTMRTCGNCHDTQFIVTHSYHATAGLDEFTEPDSVPGGRPWDTSPGWFGRWDPITYRYLTPVGEAPLDLGTPDWVRLFGWRHAGGGPAAFSRNGTPLTELRDGFANPELSALDEITGLPMRWNWQQSGVVEFNCFLCHQADPANIARKRALAEGRFNWVATATLENTGLVKRNVDGWHWNRNAFDNEGLAGAEKLALTEPSSKHCGQCHGLVHTTSDPVIPVYGKDSEWETETEGQIFSAEKLYESGMNLAGKDTLGRPWDVHAERLMTCTHCHFSLNNPISSAEAKAARPDYLSFDARRLDIGEFLKRPDHNFAKGASAQGTVAREFDGTMRRCEGCHDALSVHQWLPYKKRHMSRLLCESCHIPVVSAPARQATDWTILTKNGDPRIEYRDVQGPIDDPASLITGFRPVLLPRRTSDGKLSKLAPHNLTASWFWTYGDPPRPVRIYDLKRAIFDAQGYRHDIVVSLDTNGNGAVDPSELVLDTEQKIAAVRGQLEKLGLTDLRITGELQPYSLHHGVVTGKWTTRACTVCHSDSSIIAQPFVLASIAPGGVLPIPVKDSNTRLDGEVVLDGGGVFYKPMTIKEEYYVLGKDRWKSIDGTGIFLIVVTLIGVLCHGGFRWYMARTRRPEA